MIQDEFPLFPLAILKGLVEHKDGTAYFGSLMGWRHYALEAERLGWAKYQGPFNELKLTEVGEIMYEMLRLAEVGTQKKDSRAYLWDWKLAKSIWDYDLD